MGHLGDSRGGVRSIRKVPGYVWWAVDVFMHLGSKLSGDLFFELGVCIAEFAAIVGQSVKT